VNLAVLAYVFTATTKKSHQLFHMFFAVKNSHVQMRQPIHACLRQWRSWLMAPEFCLGYLPRWPHLNAV